MFESAIHKRTAAPCAGCLLVVSDDKLGQVTTADILCGNILRLYLGDLQSKILLIDSFNHLHL